MGTVPPPRPVRENAPVRVGIIVNNVGGYSRGVIRGVASFAFARAWHCHVEGVNATAIRRRLREFDGLIVQAATASQARMLARSALPAVNVSSALGLSRVPSVVSDDVGVGRMGAEHFLRRGHRRFWFAALDPRQFAVRRFDGFAERLAEAGFDVLRIDSPRALARAITQRLGDEAVAVMACNDRAAVAVLDACRGAGVRVPDQVAVLGVDNDDLSQSLADPPLSSVDTARERIGFEAAMTLEQLMAGEAIGTDLRLIPPKDVIVRRSTDALAIDDADVAAAARYIHAHAGRPISVADVARIVPISRRQLERRFEHALGRSMHDEILRCRIDRARRLLSDTDLTLAQVAIASGFRSATYFSVAFAQHAHATPGAYRAGMRTRDAS
jgi:LacI family transcriptional regulator